VSDEAELDEARPRRLRRGFRLHAIIYGLVNTGLVVANVSWGGELWVIWPIAVWGMALAPHFFYVRSACVDESWVEERVADLRLRSYDLGHIDDIDSRVKEGDATVQPADEREP
jgi:hypothetical protein